MTVRSLERVPGGRALSARAMRHWLNIPEEFWTAKHLFIVGCGHSGTSILLSLLGNHPRIIPISEETMFFQRDVTHQARIVRSWFEEWGRDAILAEKTPVHIHYTDSIKRIFPQSVVAGISRHPLDVVASLYLRYGDLSIATARYARDNAALESRLASGHVDVYVTYEELVMRPKQTLTSIVKMADLAYAPEMLAKQGVCQESTSDRSSPLDAFEYSPENHARYRERQVSMPLYDGRGRYKGVLSEVQQRCVLDELGDLASRLGHDIASVV